ncbi:response regulator [bacterium]|nr:response regulator [bacterium]
MFNTAVKILVVDDMLTIRKIAKKILTELHFKNIHEASDGNEAWQIINKEKPFDLVICDWNMPKLTGLELLQKIRSTPEIAETPFILLTAESDMAQVKIAIQAGVDDYVLKPFTADILKNRLEITHQKILSRKAA